MRNKIKLCIAAGILIICALISRYLFQLVLIQGDSMLPTYHSMQLVLMNKYDKKYKNGDVVCIKSRLNNGTIIIKRIIAKSGDDIVIEAGKVYVNGKLSNMVYNNQNISYAGSLSEKITLAENEYIVMGDNHENSIDSRYDTVGIIKKCDILGKIFS